ncbi:hypothetical protein chiPu_0007007 [Chiloscyllium punctatum]|uniref:Uncharacterized protein n=1 Tax=Chiloscyllium punctatum TaxID=137246 RepID=A0A401SDU4_CHIPU|nr:hypothetical protein [Chiloscyllium punctatum]
MLIVDYFTTRSSANGAAKNEDDIEMKYALLGAGIGIFLVVSFVLIKIYMIKKHIYENELTVVSGTHKQKTRRDVLETWEMSACPAPFRETLPRYSIQTKPLIKVRLELSSDRIMKTAN